MYTPLVGGITIVSGSEEDAELAMIAPAWLSTYTSKSAAVFVHDVVILRFWVSPVPAGVDTVSV